ncbi:hypothetical protein BGZ63DRAFT_407176 [Mariannaea sp. PMI_226]|nr:hypothetical protein BGZ63DRAFT_407176 [Mariannaea sp. PMI_226]
MKFSLNLIALAFIAINSVSSAPDMEVKDVIRDADSLPVGTGPLVARNNEEWTLVVFDAKSNRQQCGGNENFQRSSSSGSACVALPDIDSCSEVSVGFNLEGVGDKAVITKYTGLGEFIFVLGSEGRKGSIPS